MRREELADFAKAMAHVQFAKRTRFFVHVATSLPSKADAGSWRNAQTCVQLSRAEALSFIESTVGSKSCRDRYNISLSWDDSPVQHGTTLLFIGSTVATA